MAREEFEREDLLREATALVERVEFNADGREGIIAGFRRDGAASFFLSPNEVYQFNTTRELRRAFLDGNLYKADCQRLFRLTRERSAKSVNLIRHELTNAETSVFLAKAKASLAAVHVALSMGKFKIVGQVPAETDIISRVCNWLNDLSSPLALAHQPNVRG
jgi:hypothetical protein